MFDIVHLIFELFSDKNIVCVYKILKEVGIYFGLKQTLLCC